MAKTVIGLFDTANEARNVLQELVDAGFKREDISMVAHNANNDTFSNDTTSDSTDTGNNAGDAAGTGAVGGTVVGGVAGLLVGLGALAIPGIGPVVAAGSLATVLGSTALGAGIGAATGGLVGALVGLGVPEDDANYYSEGVRQGGTLITVNAQDNMADKAYSIMQDHGAVDIDQRGAQYQQQGFSKFDQNSQPMTAAEIEARRAASNTGSAMRNTGNAVGTTMGNAGNAMGNAADNMGSGVRNTTDKMGDAVGDMAGNAGNAIKNTGTNVSNAAGNMMDKGKDVVSDTGDEFRNAQDQMRSTGGRVYSSQSPIDPTTDTEKRSY